MNTIQIRLAGLAPCLGLTLALAGCGGGEQPQAQAPVPPLVKTLVVGASQQAASARKRYPAQVEAGRKVELAFYVGGHLVELNVVEGQRVEKGQLLARLDPRDFENRLAMSQARLAEAEREYRRYHELSKSKVSPISKSQLDEQRRAFEVARADVAQAEKELGDSYLYAPFAGLVATRSIENHEVVAPRQPVLRLENIEQLEIVVDVPEQDVVLAELKGAFTRSADVGTVHFGSMPDQAFPVKVKEFATQANPTTQLFRVVLVTRYPQGLNILPGMSATFTEAIVEAAPAAALTVPRTAVTEADAGIAYAVVIDTDTMVAERRTVTLGQETAGEVRVLKGLNPGERIVATAVSKLEDGTQVRLYQVGKLGG